MTENTSSPRQERISPAKRKQGYKKYLIRLARHYHRKLVSPMPYIYLIVAFGIAVTLSVPLLVAGAGLCLAGAGLFAAGTTSEIKSYKISSTMFKEAPETRQECEKIRQEIHQAPRRSAGLAMATMAILLATGFYLHHSKQAQAAEARKNEKPQKLSMGTHSAATTYRLAQNGRVIG